jgi:hypothetical protein
MRLGQAMCFEKKVLACNRPESLYSGVRENGLLARKSVGVQLPRQLERRRCSDCKDMALGGVGVGWSRSEAEKIFGSPLLWGERWDGMGCGLPRKSDWQERPHTKGATVLHLPLAE